MAKSKTVTDWEDSEIAEQCPVIMLTKKEREKDELQAPVQAVDVATFTFTFSHLADAFIQSDLHMCDLQCIHVLHFTLMAHCTSGAIRGSVPCSRTLRQGIELATL